MRFLISPSIEEFANLSYHNSNLLKFKQVKKKKKYCLHLQIQNQIGEENLTSPNKSNLKYDQSF